jgi:uncharacterized GH25 family protein
MNQTSAWRAAALTLCLAAPLPQAAHAHRAWLLPSATVLSAEQGWVTVDAAVSNDLFYFEHQPMRLDNLQVLAPDGATVEVENRNTGRYRSTFDVKLEKNGTYKIAVLGDMLFASYKQNGETKRVRGSAESIGKQIPADAQSLRVMRNQSRTEVFVTHGRPSDRSLQPAGVGLELAPITHPNDLFVGDEAQFRILLDGKPAGGVNVLVVPGGIRYRDQLSELKLVTDAEGRFSVNWPAPGMYWLNATQGGGRAEAAPAVAGTIEQPERRTSYAATLEVLPQ